jgi:hypothetical protein
MSVSKVYGQTFNVNLRIERIGEAGRPKSEKELSRLIRSALNDIGYLVVSDNIVDTTQSRKRAPGQL